MLTLETNALLSWLVLFMIPSVADAQATIFLFDGQSLDGWQTVEGAPVSHGWEVHNGTIHLGASSARAGQIVTTRQFEHFDLRFEWKIDKQGNSGVKYRVRKFGDRTLGCEYQILGSGFPEDHATKNGTGSLYDVYEPNGPIRLRSAGTFNRSRIVVLGNHVEHWLNGYQILTAHVGSDEWYRRKAASKFADVDGFGENRRGRIMLTDHGSETWYRNLTLTPLKLPVVFADGSCREYFTSPTCGVTSGARWIVRCQPPRRWLTSCQRGYW